jgi:RND family efflux transporter MFP subunit
MKIGREAAGQTGKQSKLEAGSIRRDVLRIALIGASCMLIQVSLAQDLRAPSVVRAESEATLSSALSSTVTALPFDEGASFLAGDVLVELDCAVFQSNAAAALAEKSGALARVASREALFSRGGTGRLEVEISKSEAAAAAARSQMAELRVEDCRILAPYDGRVVEHAIRAHEFVDPGQPVLTIVSAGAPDLEIIAPAEWLSWIEPGTAGTVTLESTGASYPVKIEAIGPVVDPVSRTIKLTAIFDGPVEDVLPGMSGLVSLESGN